jgi:predicted O-methyltransferase YrrM
MATLMRAATAILAESGPPRFTRDLKGLPVVPVGPCAGWFEFAVEGESVSIRPREALSRRCTIRPAAMFEHRRGFSDVMTIMGRLMFANGSEQEQRYTPFTLDSERRLSELFFAVESMPDDEWPVSTARWTNYQAIAKRLLSVAGVPWKGLTLNEIERLVTFGAWVEPIEGCALHALTQWTHRAGQCVIEIGSFRGRSLSMLALALRGAGSHSKVISIDPHNEFPHNAGHVRNALAEWGEEKRLVQYLGGSEDAWRILRPGCASMIFIDGDHLYDRVTDEIARYCDLLAPGGCVAFHDYGCGPHHGRFEEEHEVRKAVDDHKFSLPGFRPVLHAHS